MLKCLQTHCVWYDFDMDARVVTLLYFLQGIIGIRCFKIRDGARMVLFDRDEGGGGGSIPVGLGWHELVIRTDLGSGSYMKLLAKTTADKSGGWW